MVIRLLRPLLAILVAVALFGAPAIQAAAVRCDTMHMATASKASSGGTQAPTPCKTMPDCTDALDCASASLPVPAISVAGPLTWTLIGYWAAAEAREGLSVEPTLDPPISFI